MERKGSVRGIMFDMDNTLLKSNIDFAAMKQEIARFFISERVLPEDFSIHQHTTSTIIEHAKQQGISDSLYQAAMDIASHYEIIGMDGADLEEHARELLDLLVHRYVLVIVTNNAQEAARIALETTSIASYFHMIVGREQMQSLKPSPSGCDYATRQFPELSPEEWVFVGDSWIDGRAATDAGVLFIHYVSHQQDLAEKGVVPIAEISDLLDLVRHI
ncbi:HAD family hydrolase [Paenibacillus hexagrammi]|uniref:HAD family hydrolase n=1 Tax=Paenibacillus hexagrammi TaxID=2908839 RepID=UPI0038621860